MTNRFMYIRDGWTKDGFSFRLRPAERDDGGAICANIQAVCAEQIYLCTDHFILTDEWRDALTSSLDEESGHLLAVAEVNDTIVGHLRLFSGWYGAKGRHVGELGLSIIRPWRERGIGAAMLAYATDLAEHVRFRKLIASVIATNRRALNLFAKFGFVQEGHRVRQFNVLGQYVDEVLLAWFVDKKRQDSPASADQETTWNR